MADPESKGRTKTYKHQSPNDSDVIVSLENLMVLVVSLEDAKSLSEAYIMVL